jgi:nicotinamidase-related amidase
MPLTTLDPQTALIVIDLQKGLAGALAAFPGLVERNRALVDAFRVQGLPVVLVTADGTAPGRTEQAGRGLTDLPADFAEVIAELAPQAGDIRITKQSWGAFARTDLEHRLRALGVTQVVITGVATGAGVESTARQAYEAGFHVTLALDAIADPRRDAHDFVIAHVFPRLGETGSTADVLALLARR